MSKQLLRNITATAMMTALSIVFERILPITPPSNAVDIRITLANIPIILTGILVSPVMGAVCGVISDIIGCFISGYAPFPLLTLAPLVTGFLPGFIVRTFSFEKYDKKGSAGQYALLFCAVTVTHLFSSFVITTYGLSVMRGLGFLPMFITRVPTMVIGLFIDAFAICALYSPLKKALKK